jgi:hypothetical protein
MARSPAAVVGGIPFSGGWCGEGYDKEVRNRGRLGALFAKCDSGGEAVAASFNIYCRHCQRKVRPATYMAMYYCPMCRVPFSPAQIEQAKKADVDTQIHETEDTQIESPER